MQNKSICTRMPLEDFIAVYAYTKYFISTLTSVSRFVVFIYYYSTPSDPSLEANQQNEHYDIGHTFGICYLSSSMVRRYPPESEKYQECLFGYSGIVHTDICIYFHSRVFNNGNKSTRVSCILYIIYKR